jgi:hypothetical protein
MADKQEINRQQLWIHLVSCPINNMAFVAMKMRRRSGSCP